jgi:biotin carboxyl carrier protein
MRFLRWKYGLETPPPETKPKTLEDVKREDELIDRAKAGKLGEKEVHVEFEPYLYRRVSSGTESVGASTVDPSPTKEAATIPPPAEEETEGTAIAAPMPGMILNYAVKVGDEVKAGDTVVVLEAMKMAIDLPALVSGQIKAINFKSGDRVAKDDVLATIG